MPVDSGLSLAPLAPFPLRRTIATLARPLSSVQIRADPDHGSRGRFSGCFRSFKLYARTYTVGEPVRRLQQCGRCIPVGCGW